MATKGKDKVMGPKEVTALVLMVTALSCAAGWILAKRR